MMALKKLIPIPEEYRDELDKLLGLIGKESKQLKSSLRTVAITPGFYESEIKASMAKITAWTNRVREIELLSEASA
jgi:hypothetical protein